MNKPTMVIMLFCLHFIFCALVLIGNMERIYNPGSFLSDLFPVIMYMGLWTLGMLIFIMMPKEEDE